MTGLLRGRKPILPHNTSEQVRDYIDLIIKWTDEDQSRGQRAQYKTWMKALFFDPRMKLVWAKLEAELKRKPRENGQEVIGLFVQSAALAIFSWPFIEGRKDSVRSAELVEDLSKLADVLRQVALVLKKRDVTEVFARLWGNQKKAPGPDYRSVRTTLDFLHSLRVDAMNGAAKGIHGDLHSHFAQWLPQKLDRLESEVFRDYLINSLIASDPYKQLSPRQVTIANLVDVVTGVDTSQNDVSQAERRLRKKSLIRRLPVGVN